MSESEQSPQRRIAQTGVFIGYAGDSADEVSYSFEKINTTCDICRDRWERNGGPPIILTKVVAGNSFYVGFIIVDALVDPDAVTRELAYSLMTALGQQKIWRHLNGDEGYVYPPEVEAEMRSSLDRLN